jgi:molecular chaperone GrpE (heat shock protein)
MDEGSEYASQHVSAVLQKGYLQGEKVLRPAMVRVAS